MINNYILNLIVQYGDLISSNNSVREIISISRLSQSADFTGRIKESRVSSLRTRVITRSEHAGDRTEESPREHN